MHLPQGSWYSILFFSLTSPIVGSFQVIENLLRINFVSQNLKKLKNLRRHFGVIHLFIVRQEK